jgi:hypothetical protein
MFNYLKSFLTLTFFIVCSQSANSFDLKSLTDKLQKDLGNKLQIPKSGSNSGSSNPLGGLMKNLNTNKAGSMGSMSQSSGTSSTGSMFGVTAEQLCTPRLGAVLKNLPTGKISDLASDFGNKSSDEISKIFKKLPNTRDEFIQNLDMYDGAFETKEVEKVFSAFISKRNIEEVSTLKALSGIKTGFSKDKKQIKADATFAYGLIHFFYSPSGANKELGIRLIKEAADSPDNIGALTLYGAWQFYGKNVSENIEKGNAAVLEGYNRATEKNGNTMVSGPFYQLKKIKYPENVFLKIAADGKNPYKSSYQNTLASASQMNKNVMAKLENSKRYDAKYAFWPTVVENQDFLNKIITKMIENKGLAKEIAPLKAKYEVYKTKTATVPDDLQALEEKRIINDQLVAIAQKAYSTSEAMDQQGKKQIKILHEQNDLLILKGERTALEVSASIFASGGFSLNNAMFKAMDLINSLRVNTCKVYTTVKSYAERTQVTLSEPLSAENVDDDMGDLDGTD